MIRILLGKARWRRRRALAALQGEQAIDAWGQPSFVYLTDTHRKAQSVARDYASRHACFAPRALVYTNLLRDLWTRFGDGRAMLSPRALALIAAKLPTDPWLTALRSPLAVGTALAWLHQALRETGESLPPGPRHAPLSQSLAELDRRVAQLEGRLTTAEAHTLLLERLRSAHRPLLDYLGRQRTVIVDDILHPTPLRCELLVSLARAWASRGCEVVLSLESGRDLGGREAGVFFEYDDADDVAYALKPFQATRALRRTLFERLLATGEAELIVARRETVVPIEPWTPFTSPEPSDLSDWLYSGVPAPRHAVEQAARKLSIWACGDPYDELRAIARDVRRRLEEGALARDCVVALPELASYGPQLAAIFADFEIPCTLSAGRLLASSPVWHLLRNAFRAALGQLSPQELTGWLGSALLAPAASIDAQAVKRWLAAAGIREGSPVDWRPRLLEASPRSKVSPARVDAQIFAIEGVLAHLAPLADAHAPRGWRESIDAVVEALELGRTLVGRGAQAYGALLTCIDELCADLHASGADPIEPASFLESLEAAVAVTALRSSPAGPDRVQVVGLLELRGLTAPHLWMGGWVRGVVPAPEPHSWIVPAPVARRLETVQKLPEARYLLCSTLRNLLDDPRLVSLRLSWPRTRRGRPSAPSPLLADLLALPIAPAKEQAAAAPANQVVGDLLLQQPPAGPPFSASESLATSPPLGFARRQLEAVHGRAGAAFGSWDGLLRSGPPLPSALPVTAVETYLRCPARYWYQRVLGLREADAWSDELDPARRGTAIHRILEAFWVERGFRPIRPEEEGLEALLYRVAASVLSQVEAEGGFEPAFFRYACLRWSDGLLDDAPAGLLRAWLDEERHGELRTTPKAAELPFDDVACGPVRLRGVLDRLDELDDGSLLVTDYKTGRPPGVRAIRQGLALQPAAYAAAVARRFPRTPIATVYYGLQRADALRRTGWTGDRSLLDRILEPATRRHAVVLGPAERAEVLDYAADAIRRLARGRFHTTLADPADAGCSTCTFRRACRLDTSRNASIDQPDLQRPLES